MLRVNNGNVGLGFGWVLLFFFFVFLNNKANIFDLVSLAVCSLRADYGGFPIHRYKG